MDKDSEVETTDREEDTNELEDGTEDTDDIATQLGKMKAGTFSGQICTLKTLIDDDIVKIGDAVLSMDYMEKKYEADLLPSGCLRWTETKQVFSTPTSWVNECIKTGSKESVKGVSAWSLIKYEGKRLDAYKLRWFRKQKKSANMVESAVSNPMKGILSTVSSSSNPGDVPPIAVPSIAVPVTTAPSVALAGIANAMFIGPIPTKALNDDDPEKMMIRNMVNHEQLMARHPNNDQDMSILVKCVPFSALDRIQPFTMTMSTNALLLIDFHCHLTSGEVTGYLGGSWDTSSHNLSILQAFPCRSRLADKDRSSAVEEEIRSNLESRSLSVVGWYHSHPRSAAHPSVKDIENQIEYQVIMKGETEANYVPCVGFICSPYDEYNPGPESCYQAFWIMPPPEYRPFEYGRPMQMLYSVTRDSFLTQDLLLEMRLLAHFYVGGPDAIKFDEVFKSLDQKVDDILDCLPSNGHEEDESEGRRKEKEEKIHENLEGRNNGTDEPNSSSEQTGGSQAALNEEEKKEDEKNGKKEGEKEEKNVVSKEEEEKESGITYWEKLQGSLRPNLPRDLQSVEGQSAAQTQVQEQALAHFWAFLRGLLIPAPS